MYSTARIYFWHSIYQRNYKNQKNYLSCPKSFLCQHAVSQLRVHVFLRQQFRSVPIDLSSTVFAIASKEIWHQIRPESLPLRIIPLVQMGRSGHHSPILSFQNTSALHLVARGLRYMPNPPFPLFSRCGRAWEEVYFYSPGLYEPLDVLFYSI